MFFSKGFSVVLSVLLFVTAMCFGAVEESESVRFWSRGDEIYLVSDSAMPVWVEIPNSALDTGEELVLVLTMPADFEIVSFGESRAFAVHPKPLMVPDGFESEAGGEGTRIWRVMLGSEPVDLIEDNLPVDSENPSVRAALLICPGDAEVGRYEVVAGLESADGGERWSELEAQAEVLPALRGRRPRRLRVELFNYCGYTNEAFKEAIAQAVIGAGVNQMSDMRLWKETDTVTQRLREEGIGANWLLFWHRDMASVISERYPEAIQLNAEGRRVSGRHVFDGKLSHSWCIENRDKVKEVLIEYMAEHVVGLYDGITNDNEERALSRETKVPQGDLYTPIAMEHFRRHAGIADDVELCVDVIGERYSDQWVDFRCWQSAKLAAILSEALFEVDASITYGYYSGHKYVGALAGFSKWMYATDWEVLREIGGIHFGSSGYYGTIHDYAATTEALAPVPHVPAEMFIENFIDFGRRMPGPAVFKYRLMNSLMYGSGGFAVWYTQVLDGAAFHAISEVAAVAAEIEPFLLDGVRCDDELVLGPFMDPDSVFAYKLGQRRVVVVLNHSQSARQIRYSWRESVPKPDTVEIVSGRRYGDAQMISGELGGQEYAVFVTLSEGN